MDASLGSFMARFKFDPKRAGYVGVEREAFIVDRHLIPVPAAPQVLNVLRDDPRFTFELSACQIEMRSSPHFLLSSLGRELAVLDERLRAAARAHGHLIDCTEVAASGMCLEVFPDPTGRYQRIKEALPHETLSAACRIIGTHVHVGMRDHRSALRTYNRLVERLPDLIRIGDRSNGERMPLYNIVAPHSTPPVFKDWTAFYDDARMHNYVDNPRDNWRLIRLTAHGTVEIRAFGTSPHLIDVIEWACECQELCDD